MSVDVEQKVVEMRFDNKEFENNISTTLSSLGKLRQSLNLPGSSKGLEEVGRAAADANSPMSGLSSAVETVRTKFSALEVMGVTALANITNSAVNAGKKIISALTIDPIKTGFSEYETQINAVQTILANTSSKGTTIDDVNKALDTLNAYADKTIYNFTEMTRNIGTFTAAGVDLDTSVSSIQGIANLAAISGSTSQQASTAMYQLSQALASGTVKLQDWNSVVNAGMGGQVFQDALKRTATVMGTNVDAIIEANGSFRESLKDGWITTEVLTETLNQFTMCAEEGTKEWENYKNSLKEKGYTEEQANEILKMGKTATEAATKVKTFTQLWDTLKEAAQSGWTQSWEIIVGDFEEAKTLLTEVSDTIGAMIGNAANARNEMLQGWKDLGGRTDLIDSVRNAFEGVMSIITPIKEALLEIFPPITSKQLFSLTEGLKNLTEKFKIGKTTAENLKRTFKGVFAALDIGVQIIKAVGKGFMDIVGHILPAGNGILAFTANIGDGIVKLDEFLKSSDVLNKIFEKIGKVVGTVADGIGKFVGKISEIIKNITEVDTSGVDAFADKVKTRFEPLSKLGELVGKAFSTIGTLIEKISPVLFAFASKVGEIFSGAAETITNAIKNADFNSIVDLINSISFSSLSIAIVKFVKGLSEAKKEGGGFKGILDSIKGILDDVRGCLQAYQEQLKANVLLKIAAAIGILAASLLVISLIDSKKLATSLAAITALFGDLMGSMAIFNKISGGSKETTKACGAMIAMSIAVAILASAMKKLSDLSWEGVAKGLVSIIGLTGALVVAAKLMSNGSGKMIKGAGGLIILAAAVKILASACIDLAALSWEGIAKGLVGVGVLLTEIAAFLRVAKFDGKTTSAAIGILIMSAAIKVLASACQDFAGMSWEEIGRGLAAIAALLVEITAFTKLTGNATNVISTGAALVLIGASMKIFASAMTDFAGMSWEEIGRGLTAMAGALVLVTAAMHLLPKNMLASSVALIGVSAALVIMAGALNSMGGMSWEEIGKSLVVLAGSLIAITVAMNFMKSAISGAAAMLVMAAALAILTPQLKTMGSMSLAEIGKSMLVLAGAFTIIGVAGYVLAPIIPAILGLAGAVALLGIGCLAAGAGILAFSAGLSALAVSGAAGGAALVAIIVSIVGLIPFLIEQVGIALVALCQVIIDGAPVICEAIAAVLIAVFDALNASIPALLECLGVLLTSLIDFLLEYVPKLVEAGMQLLLGILQGIADNIQQVVEIAIEIVTNFIDGVAAGLPDIIQSGINLMISFINGMADGIRNNTDATIDAVNNLMDALIGAVIAWYANILTKGKELIGKLIDGIKAKISDAKSAVKNLVSNAVSAVKEKLSSFAQAGRDLIAGLVQGIRDKAAAVVQAARGVVSNALQAAKNLLGIKSPSRKFAEIGRQSDEGMVVGLKQFAGRVANAARGVGSGAMDAMSEALSGISDVFNGDFDTQPTIRPVLDLSDVKNGANRIGNILSGNRTLAVDTRSMNAISASMQGIQNGPDSSDVVSAIKGLRKDISKLSNTTYSIGGISYDGGSDVANLLNELIRAIKIEGRI